MRDIRFPERKPAAGPEPRPRPLRPRRRPPFFVLAIFALAVVLVVAAGRSSLMGRLKEKLSLDRPFPSENGISSTWEELRKGLEQLSGMKDAALGGIGILSNAEGIAGELVKLSLEGRGEALLSKVTELREQIGTFMEAVNAVNGGSEDDLTSALDDLDAAIDWIRNPEPRRVLVIFGNTSEIRPGGGFAGSFADVELTHGAITRMTVHDISEIDRTIDRKIVPPRPLQAIIARWRTADANWFFDFPVSARKMLELAESSGYANGARFDAVIALSPQVVADALRVTGPISLPDGTVLESNNFLKEIQKSVQAERSEGKEDPKAVLALVAPSLKEKLLALPDSELIALGQKVPVWIAEKDVMVFMRDERLAGMLAGFGADGGVYDLPGSFNGDYLAVVNAVIGTKTELVMRQTIELDSRIGADGMVSDRLMVSREHLGRDAEEWWYREANWNYGRVFVPSGAELEAFSGGTERKILPRADYRQGFIKDQDVAAIESSLTERKDGLQLFRESERQVFASWVRTAPGETGRTELSYKRRLPAVPTDGGTYTFVFESQAGAKTGLWVRIEAPEGLVFQESGQRVYEIRTDDPPGRLIVPLTFARP